MTLEELQAQVASLTASMTALTAKNAELLNEKKAEKTAREAAEAKAAEAESAKNTAEQAAATELAKKTGDWSQVKATMEAKHAADLKAITDENAALKAARDKLVVDNGLSEAIDAAGVKPEFKPAVLALLRAQGASVEIKDGEFLGKLGDKPISEAVKAFAESDAGKHYVSSDNTGAGAPGKGNAGTGNEPNPYKAETKNMTRQGWLEKHEPAKAAKFKAEAGVKPRT